jgi:hypothetical protein
LLIREVNLVAAEFHERAAHCGEIAKPRLPADQSLAARLNEVNTPEVCVDGIV